MGRLSLVLLVSLVLLSLGFTFAEETPTTVFVEDSPPYIIQNISDIFLITGENAINLLDLDDYFGEDNGEDLIITFTPVQNVTITVDSEHRVSFYPAPGYMGQQMLQFTVEDGAANITGNLFQLTVGEDTSAPRWSNMQKNKPSVYQNYDVEFTTYWTDNMGLNNFIFFINQGTGWVPTTPVLFSGLSNYSVLKMKISASPLTTVYWKFSATDIYGNTNETIVQNFTVKELDYIGGETSKEITDESVDEAGDPRVAGERPAPTKPGEFETANFKTDLNNIKLSLRQGDEITKMIKISNTGSVLLDFSTNIGNLNNFALLSDRAFTLDPGETKELLIDFKIPKDTMPDQYFGYLTINAGEEIEIPIVLDVRQFEAEISIDVVIPEKYKAVRSGKTVKATVLISSIRDIRETNLTLIYSIKDFKGNILESGSVDIQVFSSVEEFLNLTVPKSALDGEYIFYVRASGENLVDIGSDTFFVGSRLQIMRILGKFLYPFLFLILTIIIIALILIYRQNKKRQKALELYIMLNELRALVKEGKTSEATEIYKRIKVTYRQHISKDFKNDQEKFKVELSKFSKLLKQNPIKPDVPKAKPAKEGESPTKAGETKEVPATPAKPVAPKPIAPAKPVAPKPIAPAKPVAPKPIAPAKPKEIKK